MVNGRDAPGRKLDAPPGQREQLTRAIMKAIDHAAAEFAENESLDNNAAGLGSQPVRESYNFP